MLSVHRQLHFMAAAVNGKTVLIGEALGGGGRGGVALHEHPFVFFLLLQENRDLWRLTSLFASILSFSGVNNLKQMSEQSILKDKKCKVNFCHMNISKAVACRAAAYHATPGLRAPEGLVHFTHGCPYGGGGGGEGVARRALPPRVGDTAGGSRLHLTAPKPPCSALPQRCLRGTEIMTCSVKFTPSRGY